jgi:hypothetical protein
MHPNRRTSPAQHRRFTRNGRDGRDICHHSNEGSTSLAEQGSTSLAEQARCGGPQGSSAAARTCDSS